MKKGKLLLKVFSVEIQKYPEECTSFINMYFTVPVCSRCNDIDFFIRKFNSQYTGIEIECATCGKICWVTTDKRDSSSSYAQLLDFKEKVINKINSSSLPLVEKTVVTSVLNFNKVQSNSYGNTINRHSVPKSVKQEVWQRDGGKCVECGSKEKLEYDHIIPVSKGGANTVRNIQLLCENCNRTKSAKIE